MKGNKKIAWLLICILVIQIMPARVFANNQSFVPPPEITDGGISHTVAASGSKGIRPSIGLAWEKPEVLAPNPNPPAGAENADKVYAYQVELHDFQTKQTKLSEYIKDDSDRVSKQLEDLVFGYDSRENLVGERSRIENGAFYEASIHARHFHQVPIPGTDKYGSQLAPYAPGNPASIYFITDFNTQLKEASKGLSVEWEYIPGADYTLYYIAADRKTKAEILAAQDIPYNKVVIKDAEAKNLLANVDGRSYVRYNLEDVKLKQIYSVFVEVSGFSKDPSGQGMNKIYINEHTDQKGPKVVQGMPGIDIEIYNVGKDEIEIYWGQISWAEIGGNLEGIRVYARQENTNQYLVAEKKNNGNLTSIILDEMPGNTYYQVGFIIDGEEILSREQLYVPAEFRVQPLNPKVPKPYGKNLDISQTKNEYLVTGDTIPIEDINFIENTFHGKVQNGTTIQLVWDAPKKQDDKLKNEIDYELYYDIWISDNLESLSVGGRAEPVIKDLQINEGDDKQLIKKYENEDVVIGMKTTLTKYTDKNLQLQPLKSNHTYYIKIVAKRAYGNQFVKSQETHTSINLDKDGNISVPPVIGKPPLRIKADGITTSSIALEWRTIWYEILTKNLGLYEDDKDEQVLAEIGSTKIYTPPKPVEKGPSLHFRYKEGWKLHTLLTSEDVKEVKDIVTADIFDKDYYSRRVELGDDVQYELKVLPYEEVEKQLAPGQSIENWVATSQKGNTESWNTIMPTEGQEDDRGLRWKEHIVGGLMPNTRYVMMIRAYRITTGGEKLMQSFPSYIIATTLTDFEDSEVIPVVPSLQLESYTDTAISVYWKYNKDFDYELVYSKKDNPDEAITWDLKISNDASDENYVPNGEKAVATIYGLFPQTTYNVWIRAKQKIGTEVSAWSNPVTVKTKDIRTPDVPTGLGPVAPQSLAEIDKTFPPISSDYITIEWTKDLNDKGVGVEGDIERRYEYDIEFADNVEFLDSIVVNVTEALKGNEKSEILAKNIVKFNKLIANSPYYVRVKTRVILKEVGSDNEIRKESDYSKWVRIFTKTSNDEYDGGENENIVVYPDAIIQDYSNGKWTWEIVDAQKVIKDIKTSNKYFYTISMELYKNRREAYLRQIKIPVSVIEALISSKMELQIVTEVAIYEIPAHTMKYYIQQANAKDMIQIELEEILAYDLGELVKPFPHVMESAEKLSIRLQGQHVTKAEMGRFDGNIKVALKLNAKDDYQRKTLKTYTYDYSYGDWILQPHRIDTRQDATYSVYSAPSTGIYALYSIMQYASYRDTNAAMDYLLSRYNIEKLGTKYKKNQVVHSDPFINLLMGIAEGKSDIDMDAPISQNMKKARNAGVYKELSSGTMTYEMTIHGIVRLYEMTTGNRLKPSKLSFTEVSKEYRESVSKAYALGLITDLSPKAPMTYGELANLIQLILP